MCPILSMDNVILSIDDVILPADDAIDEVILPADDAIFPMVLLRDLALSGDDVILSVNADRIVKCSTPDMDLRGFRVDVMVSVIRETRRTGYYKIKTGESKDKTHCFRVDVMASVMEEIKTE